MLLLFFSLFCLTIIPSYYVKSHIREFAFYLKIKSIESSNKRIRLMAKVTHILCNSSIYFFSLFIIKFSALFVFCFIDTLPHTTESTTYKVKSKKGRLMYFDINSCYNNCVSRQIKHNECKSFIHLPQGTVVKKAAIVTSDEFLCGFVLCRLVQTEDGLWGWI